MELMEFLKQAPWPVLLILAVGLLAVTVTVAFQYVKMKRLDGIREDVYQLFLRAEHIYKSGEGQQKLKWVVNQAMELLPQWLRVFVTVDMLMKIIDRWFAGVKDLLDDGKVNGSQTQI